MLERQRFIDEYQAAMKAERELWAQVHQRGPGHPEFSRELWQRWLDAVGRTNEASRAMHQALSAEHLGNESDARG